MNKKVKAIADEATKLCLENGIAVIPWIWQEMFGQLMIKESMRFLNEINSCFEAEQLEDFWNDPTYGR